MLQRNKKLKAAARSNSIIICLFFMFRKELLLFRGKFFK